MIDKHESARAQQRELDQVGALLDLDQSVAHRGQAREDLDQDTSDNTQVALAAELQRPAEQDFETRGKIAQRQGQLLRSQTRRDAHQIQLDSTQGGLEARQGVLDEEQQELDGQDSSAFARAEAVAARFRASDNQVKELMGQERAPLAESGEGLADRRDAETRLRESEARFRSVTEAAVDAIVSTDQACRITSWNPGADRVFGYSAQEAVGANLAMLVPDDQVSLARDYLRRRLADPHHQRADPIELWALHKNGARLPIEASLGSWDADGEPHFCVIARDIAERRRTAEALQHLVDHDSLTGLLSRRRFEAELTRIAAELERYPRKAALLVMDLDGFKLINDRHGHAAGDALLTNLGAVLKETVRKSDFVARLGGDEFGLVILEADQEQAALVADKIVRAVRAGAVIEAGARQPDVTASVGITLMNPDSRATSEELLIQADRAMYDAKSKGGNGHAFASGVFADTPREQR